MTFSYVIFSFLMLFFVFLINYSQKYRKATRKLVMFFYTIFFLFFFLLVVLGLLILLKVSFPLLFLKTVPFLKNNLYFSKFNIFTSLCCFFFSFVGFLIFSYSFRRYLSFFLPLDANNYVHIFTIMAVVLGLAYFSIFLSIDFVKLLNERVSIEDKVTLFDLWYSEFFYLFLSFLGVGLFTRRSLREVFVRLGFENVKLKDVIKGINYGFFILAISLVIGSLALKFGMSQNITIDKLTHKLLGTFNLGLLFSLSFGPALGEEVLYRGALQPRLGISLTSLLFALSHMTYGLSFITLNVFVVGIILSFLRKNYNIVVCIVSHAFNNFIFGLLCLLGVK